MNGLLTRSRSMIALLGLGAVLALAVACSSDNPNQGAEANNANNGAINNTSLSSGDLAPSNAAVYEALARSASVSMPHGGNLPGIWVNGSGEVTVTPDLAILNLGVEANAETVAEARAEAAAAMEAMIEVLEANGIEESDIKTEYFNIHPNYTSPRVNHCIDGRDTEPVPDDQPAPAIRECYENYEQIIVGYRVSNQLSVKARDLDNLGNLIDAVTEAAGDNIRFNGVSFTVEDPKELEEQARAAAVADAMEKAEQFADLTGSTLGKLIYITETSYSSPKPYEVAERAALAYDSADGAPTQILAGEQDVVVTVQAVFDIE